MFIFFRKITLFIILFGMFNEGFIFGVDHNQSDQSSNSFNQSFAPVQQQSLYQSFAPPQPPQYQQQPGQQDQKQSLYQSFAPPQYQQQQEFQQQPGQQFQQPPQSACKNPFSSGQNAYDLFKKQQMSSAWQEQRSAQQEHYEDNSSLGLSATIGLINYVPTRKDPTTNNQ